MITIKAKEILGSLYNIDTHEFIKCCINNRTVASGYYILNLDRKVPKVVKSIYLNLDDELFNMSYEHRIDLWNKISKIGFISHWRNLKDLNKYE